MYWHRPSLQKVCFVKSREWTVQARLGFQRRGEKVTKRQIVKSSDGRAADEHERDRDYLGLAQIDQLLASAKKGRHGVRDHLLILMMFRHGLRVSEAIALRRSDVDLGSVLINRIPLWVGL